MDQQRDKVKMGPTDPQDVAEDPPDSSTAEVCIQAENITLRLNAAPRRWKQRFINVLTNPGGRVDTVGHQKIILDDVSISFRKGTLTAILGGSGSGKSSLLNVLADRARPKEMSVIGDIIYMGNPNIRSIDIAYLVQHDVLPETLTVRETLDYSAQLRRPLDNADAREVVVQSLLQKLHLAACADTRLGGEQSKGCSGGERRRTSIGIQLLSDAEILLCDEPTTGLDATTALQVIKILNQLAQNGLTVVISIHAPRSDMWQLFDHIALLSRGSVLYSGLREESIPYFHRCGYEMPPFVNPAEYLVDLAATDTRTRQCEHDSTARLEYLKSSWASKQISHQPEKPPTYTTSALSGASERNPNQPPTLMRELRVLTARNMKMFIRDPKALAGAWGGALAMAVVNGWVFMNMDRSEAGIRSREGSLWNATELYGYLILVNELYRMNVEIKFFDHERQDGITTSAGFLLSRRASKLLLEDLTIPPCFTLIYYFFAGYSHSARQFFIFLVMMWLSHFNAISFAGLSTAISRHFLLAGFLGNLYFTLQMVAAGYFIPSTQMPVYIGWLRWITHTFYTFGALAANEFIGAESPSGVGQFYDCPYSNNPSDPSCKQYTGAYIMESLGLPRDWIWKPVVILCVIAFICYLWAALILHYNPLKPVTRHVGERIERIDPPEIRFSPAPSPQAIAITLQKYGLKEKSQLSKRSSLLGPISTEFRPGRLTAVMGASGSGKTTLLSALSGRLATSTKARYQSIGSIMYNNTSLPEDKVRFVASFVNQDDVHLMPSLTVRETLQFVARLKLPDSLSREEKDARAEVMLRKFGLRHCADTLIGNSVTKGISGGEKRRVSIVCEILRTPDIVVLDEPTSGLDSFIALSVIEILHDLAKEGRTVILSIHQPTARMLRYFSDILVLGTEGLPVYSGPAQDMLRYFQNLGIECPHTMSPTDFVMDLATPDPGDNSGQQRVGYLVQRMKGNERLMKDVDISPSTSGSDGSVASGSVHLPTTSRNTFRKSFVLVLQRAAVNLSRQPILILARTLQLPGMAILLALFFAPLQKDYLAVQSRVGFVQQYACVGFVGMIQSMATYPSERDVFYREASENLYGAESFMLQYTLLELPLEVFSCAIFALFTAYVTDLNPTVGQFGVSLLGAFGCLSSGESISIIFSTVISHSGAAISLTCALLGIFTVLGGVISLHVPPVLRALNHISPPKYAIASILNYSMKGLRFTCTDSQKKPDGSCLIGTGEEVLEMYNMTDELRWSLMGLVLCTLGYRLLAYVVLKLRSTWWLRK